MARDGHAVSSHLETLKGRLHFDLRHLTHDLLYNQGSKKFRLERFVLFKPIKKRFKKRPGRLCMIFVLEINLITVIIKGVAWDMPGGGSKLCDI